MPQLMDDALAMGLYRRRPNVRTGGDQTHITYSREFWSPPNFEAYFGGNLDRLIGQGVAPGVDVLVVGCGFGYLIEYGLDAGLNVYGIDGGPYYWKPENDGEWRSDVKARVANDWIGSGTEVASLQALPGISGQARFTFIVDEDCATMHSDAELPAFIAACEDRLQGNARGRIVHLVTTGTAGNQAVNWKSLAEWKAVAPSHTWIDIRTGEIG